MRKSAIIICLILLYTTSSYAQVAWDESFSTLQEQVNAEDFDEVTVDELYANTIAAAIETYGKNHEAYVYTLIVGVKLAFRSEAYEEGLERVNEQLKQLASLSLDYQYYANALYNASQLHIQLNQTDEALDFAKQYLDILSANEQGSMKHAIASYEYANLLYQKKEPSSLDALQRSLSLLNKYPSELGTQYLYNLYYLGTLNFEAEKYEEATKLYNIVIGICEENNLEQNQLWKSVMYNNAFIYQDNKQLSEAISAYESLKVQLEKDQESDTELYKSVANNLGVLYQRVGNVEGADLVNISGTDVQSYINAAAIAFQKGDYDLALKKYQNALDSITVSTGEDSLLTVKIDAQRALVWKEKGQYDSAKQILNQALSSLIVQNNPAKEESLMVYINLGDVYLATGTLDSAASMFNLAKGYLDQKSNSNTALAFQINNSLGILKTNKAQFNEAKVLFESNLSLIDGTFGQNSKEYAQTLNNLGSIAVEEGDYLMAEDYYINAGTILEKLNPDALTRADLYRNLAIIAHGKTDFHKADSLYKKAAEIYKDNFGDDHVSLLNLYPKVALIQLALGNYPSAEQYFRKVINLSIQNYGENSLSYANAISGIGLYYQNTGNLGQAKKHLNNAIDIYLLLVGKNHPSYITAIENLSSIYQSENDLAKALPLLQEALIADSITYGIKHPNYAATLHNIASLYLKDESYAKAEQMYQKAIKIDALIFGNQSPIYASTLYNLAVLYQKTSKIAIADSMFSKVAELRKNILGEQHPDYIYTLYGWGLLKQTNREIDTAYQLLNKAVTSYLYLFKEYFPSMSESEKAAFFHKVNPVFEAYKDFALENYHQIEGLSSQLFDLQLNTKAMLLNASSKMRNKILNSNDQALKNEFSAWLALKELAVQYYSYTKEELAREDIDLISIEEKINAMEKSLSLKSNVFNTTFLTDSLNWLTVRNQLPPNSAVLEIVRVKKSLKNDSIVYAGLLVTDTSEEPQITILQNGKTIEQRWFKAYQNLIRYKYKDTLSYDKLWEWIDKDIPDGLSKLYVSPDGIYNKININTLYNKEADEFLLEKENIRIITSARDLLNKREETSLVSGNMNNRTSLVLFGSPDFDLGNEEEAILTANTGLLRLFNGHIPALPGTLIEVNAIDSLTTIQRWDVSKFIGKEATEIAIDDVKSPFVLHIASHGFFKNVDDRLVNGSMNTVSNNENPLLRSGLLLAGATTGLSGGLPYENSYEDGLLTAYETMNLDLEGTELVVLSACETGLGEVKNGEGVYGLQRAFLVAGARNLIMSLWTVNDHTTQLLMTEFYKRWTQGEDRFTAFRNAQFKIKEDYPEPYYWAAFTIIGQ